MYMRVLGQSAQEARLAGASIDKQLAYGVTKATIEIATEKMFDGVAKIYGKGAADEITEKLIGKLAETDTGRSIIRLIVNGAGEGAEEVVSDLLSPLAESIYKEESIAELYKQLDPSDILYSFLIGEIIGFMGGGVNIVNGGNAQANSQLRMQEAFAPTNVAPTTTDVTEALAPETSE